MNRINKITFVGAVSLLPLASHADVYADIAAGVDFAGAVTGIGLMAVAVSVLLIARKGIRLVLTMLG